MQKTTLGDFELVVLSDGTYNLDAGAMFGVVPKTLWSKIYKTDDLNRLRAGLNTLVVRNDDHLIVIETGIGNKLSDKLRHFNENEELLISALQDARIDPEEVDIVINTHLHFDHCGWNTFRDAKGDIKPTFPRAKYYFQRAELEHAHEQHERDRISYISDNYDPLVKNGQAVVLEGNREIVPGVSVELFPGHTRGHQAVLITSNGKTACYIGDLIPTTRHLTPTWVMAFDLYPLETIEHRHRYYSRAISENWLTIFTHDHENPWAYVSRDKDGKYFASPSPEQVRAA